MIEHLHPSQPSPVIPAKIARWFGPKGRLEKSFPGFSTRIQQETAAAAVEAAMAQKGIALIEAGTGVGKTLAYLIPAIQRARPTAKIVISTHTLALQAQLAEKDVPLAQLAWGKPVPSAVVKGRGNYLCLQDYEAAQGDLWTVGDPQFNAIGQWSRTSETGDLAELDFNYVGWGEIRANFETCKGPECRFYPQCFYYRMRRDASEAALLLVNHALFFSDLAMRGRGEENTLLPDYDFVVFDEAHHLETAAAAAFGIAFSSSRLPTLIDRIRRTARNLDIDLDRLKAIDAAAQTLFAPFLHYPKPDFFVQEVLGSPDALQMARGQVGAIGMMLDGLATELQKQDTEGHPALKDRVDGMRRQCVRAKEELTQLFMADDPNFIRWGAGSRGGRRGPQTTLNWTPISVGPLLEQALWRKPRVAGAALISATLSTDGGFGYLRERLGLDIPAAISDDASDLHQENDILETVVGSPFDYEKNCLLYLPAHLPIPSEDPGYLQQAMGEVEALITASHGGAFLLFTSHRALNAAYDQITQSDLPFPLLRQGEMPNARLIQTFREEKDAVLFGTQSFWEGVDLPGDHLRLVIIDRIPFAVPDSPLHKARVDAITAAGGDWFGDYALPQAQLKLKQGFGRLIRSASDRGVVALLDTRLLRKNYGARFLRFLPPARRTQRLEDVHAFLHPKHKKARKQHYLRANINLVSLILSCY